MNIQRRLCKIEEKLSHKSGKAVPIDCCHLIFVGDGKGEQRISRVERRHVEKYGTTKGLIIITTVVRDPKPLPDHFKPDVEGS